MFQKEDAFVDALDFDSIKKKYDSKDEGNFEKVNEKFNDKLKEIASEMEKLAPNRKSIQQYEEATVRAEVEKKIKKRKERKKKEKQKN